MTIGGPLSVDDVKPLSRQSYLRAPFTMQYRSEGNAALMQTTQRSTASVLLLTETY